MMAVFAPRIHARPTMRHAAASRAGFLQRAIGVAALGLATTAMTPPAKAQPAQPDCGQLEQWKGYFGDISRYQTWDQLYKIAYRASDPDSANVPFEEINPLDNYSFGGMELIESEACLAKLAEGHPGLLKSAQNLEAKKAKLDTDGDGAITLPEAEVEDGLFQVELTSYQSLADWTKNNTPPAGVVKERDIPPPIKKRPVDPNDDVQGPGEITDVAKLEQAEEELPFLRGQTPLLGGALMLMLGYALYRRRRPVVVSEAAGFLTRLSARILPAAFTEKLIAMDLFFQEGYADRLDKATAAVLAERAMFHNWISKNSEAPRETLSIDGRRVRNVAVTGAASLVALSLLTYTMSGLAGLEDLVALKDAALDVRISAARHNLSVYQNNVKSLVPIVLGLWGYGVYRRKHPAHVTVSPALAKASKQTIKRTSASLEIYLERLMAASKAVTARMEDLHSRQRGHRESQVFERPRTDVPKALAAGGALAVAAVMAVDANIVFSSPVVRKVAELATNLLFWAGSSLP